MRRLLFIVALAVGLLAVLAAPALAGAATFTVHPSGGNDTHNIQRAFDRAIAAGPGSVVRLTAGQFSTNTIWVKGFHGTFKGAGQGKTVIDATGPGTVGLHLDKRGCPVEPFPFLIGFKGGDVSVHDMSFDIEAPGPAVPWTFEGDSTPGLLTVVLVTGSADSTFDRVDFVTGYTEEGRINAFDGLLITGKLHFDANGFPAAFAPTGGRDRVARCYFSQSYGVACLFLKDGRLTVGGRPGQGNVFDDNVFPCGMSDNSDSDIVISHNRMTSYGGNCVVLWAGVEAFASGGDASALLPPLPAPRYLIADNTMIASGYTDDSGAVVAGAGGVLVFDLSWLFGVPDRLQALIAHNTITMDNGGWDGGIDGIGARCIRVVGNRIRGTGLAGIDVGADFLTAYGLPAGPTRGWRLIGNDVSGVDPVSAYGGPAAPIWLGTYASLCLVVGGPKPTRVLDQGTDDILINVAKAADLAAPLAAPRLAPSAHAGAAKVVRPF